jgi:hypothetical protein
MLAGIAEFERELIKARTGEVKSVAVAKAGCALGAQEELMCTGRAFCSKDCFVLG